MRESCSSKNALFRFVVNDMMGVAKKYGKQARSGKQGGRMKLMFP